MNTNPETSYTQPDAMRWIYISPHFDDAVLSCGGLIWEQTHTGIPVEIWTICAGSPPPGPLSPFAQAIHDSWNTGTAEETVALRRIEDQNSCRRVGAQVVHFPVSDCIYRRSRTGSLLYAQGIFGGLNPRDESVIEEVVSLLSARINQYDVLVCPLGIGAHVDHLIVRAALERLNRPLWYYADIPYYFKDPDSLPGATNGLMAKNFYVSAEGLQAWQESIAAHKSQISILFEDETDMRQKIRDYAQKFEGLRLWERGQATPGS
jgi:LmbE family N-acetylglucosaminyl deacetylase